MAVLVAFGAVAVVWAVALVRHLAFELRFEDAYIVLRYARNLVEGHGFVFNPGERVLGVTTPLYTLVSTLFVALGEEAAPVWQNVAGILWLALQGLMVLLLGARLGRPLAALPAALLTLGNWGTVYLYVGMETHLFTALVLLVCWLWLAEEPRPGLLGLVLGLAFLVRYDAALLAGLVGLERWASTRRFPWRTTLVFFMVVSPWLLFAQLYFGSILPAPAGAKSGFVAPIAYLRQVFEYSAAAYARLFDWFSPWHRPAVWLGRAFLFPIVLGVLAAGTRRPRTLLVALYPFLHLLVYAGVGSDPGFTWHVHLLHPFGFLFFALGAEEAVRLLGRASAGWWEQGPLGRSPRAVATLLVVVACVVPVAQLARAARPYRMDPLTQQLHRMGEWLGAHYPPETSLLQPAIGTLGWESRLRIVDHAGLVTPGLYFFHDQECTPLAEVVELHAPDLILHSQWSPAEPETLGYRAVHEFTEPFRYVVFERDAVHRPDRL